jgi:carboxynorspermidine decarboxylase
VSNIIGFEQTTAEALSMINYPLEAISSPAFILDENRLLKNLQLIHHVSTESNTKVLLALKGFAFWRVFPLIGQYLSGATASSLHEARLIVEEMGKLAHVYVPAYSPADFPKILPLCSHLTFNSLTQYHTFAPQVRAFPSPIALGLRVNPEYSDVTTALYNPASPTSRLGVKSEDLTALPEEIEGLHCHSLCESGIEATENLIFALEDHFSKYFSRLQWLNLGGGHLMTRKGYDTEKLIEILKNFKDKYPHLTLYLEPGSAIAWETGELIATVLDIVESGGVKTAMLDVSFTAHMPDTLEMPYKPRILGALEPQTEKPTYRMGGCSCLAGDFIDGYSFEKPLKIGDKLIFLDMMHYTMVKTTVFNGVNHPNLYLWGQNNTLELVRQFDYTDYKDRLS